MRVMESATKSPGSYAVVYDAHRIEAPSPGYFSIDFWRSQKAVQGEAIGRGSAWFVASPEGPVVLRHYLRGGWAAKISRQRYLFTGVKRSRPFREYDILSALSERGMPVPKPVAAICKFSGLTYTGAIITVTIPSTLTLADLLMEHSQGAVPDIETWQKIGNCIRRFHDAGVWHADLNARNILLDDQQRVFLIDFDRAKYSPGKVVNGQGNMNRLKRSLVKLWPSAKPTEIELAWEQLMVAYNVG